MVGGGKNWLGSHDRISVMNIVFHFLFLHGFNPFYMNSIIGVEWYLGVLFIFYLAVPLMFKKIKSLESAMIFYMASVVICGVFQQILIRVPLLGEEDIYLWNVYVENYSIIAQLPVLMMGIVCYFVYKDRKVVISKKMSCIIIAFSIYLIYVLTFGGNLQGLGVTLWGLAFGGIVIALKDSSYILFDNILFNNLGKYSYGIYLFHFLIIRKTNSWDLHIENIWGIWIIKYVLVVAISFCLSFLLTNFFEKPIVKKMLIIKRKRRNRDEY